MKFHSDIGFNIMVTGRWNPAIFSPQWVKDNVVRDDSTEVMLAIPMTDPIAPPRISYQNIQIFPAGHYLDVRPTECGEDACVSAGATTEKILKLLPHTPMIGLGINIRFVENANALLLSELFSFPDSGRISAERYSFAGAAVSRSFLLAGGDVLNLGFSLKDAQVTAEFNFHTESRDPVVFIEKTASSNVMRRYQEALSFMRDTYNLELED